MLKISIKILLIICNKLRTNLLVLIFSNHVYIMAYYVSPLDTTTLINLSTVTRLPNLLTTSLIANVSIPYIEYRPQLYYSIYQDINTDPELRNTMTTYFYEKTIQNLKDDFSDLYKYVIQTNNDVRLIKNLNEYDKNDRKFTYPKMDFLIENFISSHKVKDIIKKYVAKNNIKWYDLKKYKDSLLDYIHSKIRKNIKNQLN
jgi:hypothetical protein